MIQIKICGITNKEDALFAASCGAAALGFIFYPSSPRYISPENAKKIINDLPEEIIRVGVFVNEKADTIKKTVKDCAIDMIQLHGDESPEYCRQFPPTAIIKAVELKNHNDLNHALSYNTVAILVDSRHAGLYGGTGKKANWELASDLRDKKPIILSGGLNRDNVSEALRMVRPAALDINSGVEVSPGKKDHKKLAQIFNIISAEDVARENSLLIFSKRNL